MKRRTWSNEELLAGIRGDDDGALARAISLVENGDPAAPELLRGLYGATGHAFTVGVTGPPGAGKSTLIGALIGHLRTLGSSVGVLSIDPSSPFTKGALLGDRLRLGDRALDKDVFIRSMSARGHPGGIARATLQAVLLLDASGKDVVFVETVGAGQGEVDVRGVVDAVLLVLMPGSGDSVQALKAGIMEIPDLIVVNKADLAGADAACADLRSVLGLTPEPARRPPLLATAATTGDGVSALWDALVSRRDALAVSGALEERRRRNLRDEVLAAAVDRFRAAVEWVVDSDGRLTDMIEAVGRRELDPDTAVEGIVTAVLGGGSA